MVSKRPPGAAEDPVLWADSALSRNRVKMLALYCRASMEVKMSGSTVRSCRNAKRGWVFGRVATKDSPRRTGQFLTRIMFTTVLAHKGFSGNKVYLVRSRHFAASLGCIP